MYIFPSTTSTTILLVVFRFIFQDVCIPVCSLRVCGSAAALTFFIHVRARICTQVSYSCKCSFYEIFNEKVFDLVDESNRDNPMGLTVREDTRKGVYVEGLMEEDVSERARETCSRLPTFRVGVEVDQFGCAVRVVCKCRYRHTVCYETNFPSVGVYLHQEALCVRKYCRKIVLRSRLSSPAL